MGKTLKRVNKTKKDIIVEDAQVKEVARQRKRFKDELYPFLVANSSTVKEAQMLCRITSSTIQMAFTNQMLKQKVSELALNGTQNGDDFDKYKKLLELLNDETVTSATTIIESMTEAIDQCIRKQASEKKLDELDLSQVFYAD